MSDVRLFLLGLVSSAALACGGTTEPPPAVKCGGAAADTYVAGLAKTSEGGKFDVTLLDSVLAPPDRGENTFTLKVRENASGTMMAPDAIEVRPWMPQHGHGSTPPSFVPVAGTEANSSVVGPINFFMPGLWELRVLVTPAGDQPAERTVFSFCVEG